MKHRAIPTADAAIAAQQAAGMAVVRQIMDAGENQGDLWIAECLFINAEKARKEGSPAGAMPIFDEAIVWFQKLAKQEELSACRCNLGLCLKNLGRHQEAIEQFEQAYKIDVDTGNISAQSMALTNIGLCYNALSVYQQALDMFQASMRLDQGGNDGAGVAYDKNNIGMTLSSMGQYDEAIEYLKSAISEYKRLELWENLPNPLINLGNVLNRKGAYAEALSTFEQIRALPGGLSPLLTAKYYNGLGSTFTGIGDLRTGIAYCHAALDIYRQLGSREGISRSLGMIGEAYLSLGEYQAAYEMHEAKKEIDENSGDLHGMAIACHGMAKVLAAQGKHHEAISLFEQAALLNKRVKDVDFQQTIYINQAGAYFEIRNIEASLKLLVKAQKLNRTVKSDTASMLCHLRFSNLALLEERLKTARYHARAAYKMAQKTGAKRTEIMALSNLAIGWLSPDTLRKAYYFGKKALDLAELYLSNQFVEDFSLSHQSDFISLYNLMAVLTYEQNKNRESFNIMEMAKSRVLSKQLGLRIPLIARSGNEQIKYLIERERSLAESIHVLQARQRDEGLTAENMSDLNQYSDEMNAILLKLKDLAPNYYNIRAGIPLTYEKIKRLLV